MPVNNNIEFSGRPNEFGNIVANLFAVECRTLELDYQKPKDTQGKGKESGYPDGYLFFENRHFYVELKTCEERQQKQTLRTFFLFSIFKFKNHLRCSAFACVFLNNQEKWRFVIKWRFSHSRYERKASEIKARIQR